MENQAQNQRNQAVAWVIGCGGFILLLIVAAVTLVVVFADDISESFGESFESTLDQLSGEDWGVKAPNEMSESAHAFIDEEGLVKEGETLLAYYDKYANQMEVAVLTNEAVRYFNSGRVTEVLLKDVQSVKHHQRKNWDESLDVVLIRHKDGQMKVEIFEYEGGESFYEMTKDAWNDVK
jgi:hypothetical protein